MYLLGREAIRDSRISGNSDIQITSLLVGQSANNPDGGGGWRRGYWTETNT